ncbi:MAG: DUF1523 family protein [Paracoccaceae bacterium]
MSGYIIWGLIIALVIAGWIFLSLRYPAGSRGRSRMKWGFRACLAALVLGFLHYTLPQHDIVRISNTYNRLTSVGWENSWAYASPDAGTSESTVTRDIRFIEAAYADGGVIVYRNEDTGWIWPPYFKYDSSNLQAEASIQESRSEPYSWVSVTHYGWRIPFLSIYPNAVRIRAVDGPNATVLPWVNVLILTVLALIGLMIRRMWLQFRERTIDPALADVDEVFDDLDARADATRARARGFWGRIRAWLATWRAK